MPASDQTRSPVWRVATAAMRSRANDLAIVLGATAIISLLILPVPASALDLLIAFNILIGVTLILVAIYIGTPTDFTVFPSILLITTLYRLSLSIATTRTILTTAHAGHIIDVFGNVTAGGNLVVGLVVFLIVTLVQFIVIAKGAERVGEVAARFSLDAMPGKQMSIDSDLRAGLIDKDEARRRRRLLELESKLHGSLDGAMKFVKGDAIAGIVVVAINLLGGLTVGVLQQHMTLGDAIQTYSVLTIGDGMVTQIPALLSAMSAGLIVTRISGDDQGGHLGEAIQRQLTQKPRVPLMTGVLCLAMAGVPGFPHTVFGVLGAICLFTGVALDPGLRQAIGRRLGPLAPLVTMPLRAPEEATRPPGQTHRVQPLLLELSGQFGDRAELVEALSALLDDFKRTLGVSLPRIGLVDAVVADGPPEWRLLAFDAWIGGGEAPAEAAARAVCDGVRETLRRNLALFVGVQETADLLHAAAADHPEVAREVSKVLSPMRIAEVLRLLVDEEAPIRNIHLILEALADAAQKEKDGLWLAAQARIAIGRQIVARYAHEGRLNAIALSPGLENQLRSALNTANAPAQLALEPGVAQSIIRSIGEAAADHAASVLVTAQDLRRPVRKLIATEFFDLAVIAYNELRPPLKLAILGRPNEVAPRAVGAAA